MNGIWHGKNGYWKFKLYNTIESKSDTVLGGFSEEKNTEDIKVCSLKVERKYKGQLKSCMNLYHEFVVKKSKNLRPKKLCIDQN